MIHKCGIVLILSLVATAGAFVLPSATPLGSRTSIQMRAGREQDSSTSMERRDLLQNSVGKMLGLSALMLGGANLMGASQRVQAAVGEGTCREWKGMMCSAVAELYEWSKAHMQISPDISHLHP